MFCSKCGKENPDGSIFCSSCGADISGSDVSKANEAGKSVSKKTKAIAAVLLIFLLIGIVLILLSVFSKKEQLVPETQDLKSEIVGIWYKDDSEFSRTVFVFTDNGELLMRGESGDFSFHDYDGTLCGEWEVNGEDSIYISYDNAESLLADAYFGGNGLANVEIAADRSSITFYVEAINGSKFTLIKYPDNG